MLLKSLKQQHSVWAGLGKSYVIPEVFCSQPTRSVVTWRRCQILGGFIIIASRGLLLINSLCHRGIHCCYENGPRFKACKVNPSWGQGISSHSGNRYSLSTYGDVSLLPLLCPSLRPPWLSCQQPNRCFLCSTLKEEACYRNQGH